MVKICEFDYPIEKEDKYKNCYALFPYALNPFQKHSIEAIYEGNHSLVTAHTGTGKSTCAEFAIHHFVEKGKKVIYCSPIKALSNQKYYDFVNKYPNYSIGLLTGDIKTNPDADVIICTTEILTNYLFTCSNSNKQLDFQIDIDNEVACVVFDEVHYINDKERGAAWEKAFIMLPPHIQLVMLSATIDNSIGFAEWIESGRQENKENKENKIVYLSSTRSRIIPLTDYSFITTNEGIFKKIKDKQVEKFIRDNTNKLVLLNDSANKFNEINYNTINKILKIFDTNRVYLKRQHVLNNLMFHLKEKDLLPALAYVYSRKQCEIIASEITVPLLEDDSKIPYTIRRECEQIIRRLPNYKEYLELPEYNFIVSLLEKGIAIHNSGLLPIIREMVELLIMKKYIKLLICTESFSVGLNAPIKTCIFTSLTKYDNHGQRYLTTSEFGQGKGRAGRLGLDKFGTVIHLNNLFTLPTITEYKLILCGKPQQLVSKFHINYALILNLIKNGQTHDFHHFSEKSMIHNELTKHKKQQETVIADLLLKKQKKIGYVQLLTTPFETCIHYKELEDTYMNFVNKKRKEKEREMQVIQDEYKSLITDVKCASEYVEIMNEIEKEENYMNHLNTYIQLQTEKVIHILVESQFIRYIEGVEKYGFTQIGLVASLIAEVHPLILTQFLVDNNYFIDFSIKQLVGLFSCFTDIKIQERLQVPTCVDLFLRSRVRSLQELYDSYQTKENTMEVQTGINYNNVLMFDMIDLSMKWCECNTEEECKQFIQKDLAEFDISIGDFNKAMLKIITITKELINACEQLNLVQLLHKLTQIDILVLKYITTNQSLYI